MKRERVRLRQVTILVPDRSILPRGARPLGVICGHTEFLRPLRGFCVSVRELNDALFWLTVEGAPGKIEVACHSLNFISFPRGEWEVRLKQIFST